MANIVYGFYRADMFVGDVAEKTDTFGSPTCYAGGANVDLAFGAFTARAGLLNGPFTSGEQWQAFADTVQAKTTDVSGTAIAVYTSAARFVGVGGTGTMSSRSGTLRRPRSRAGPAMTGSRPTSTRTATRWRDSRSAVGRSGQRRPLRRLGPRHPRRRHRGRHPDRRGGRRHLHRQRRPRRGERSGRYAQRRLRPTARQRELDLGRRKPDRGPPGALRSRANAHGQRGSEPGDRRGGVRRPGWRWGVDALRGAAGADTFVFSTSLVAGVDTVLDFSREEGDRIAVDDVLIPAIGAALDPYEVKIGTEATDPYHRLVYNPARALFSMTRTEARRARRCASRSCPRGP
jgi:hypothetical protein